MNVHMYTGRLESCAFSARTGANFSRFSSNQIGRYHWSRLQPITKVRLYIFVSSLRAHYRDIPGIEITIKNIHHTKWRLLKISVSVDASTNDYPKMKRTSSRPTKLIIAHGNNQSIISRCELIEFFITRINSLLSMHRSSSYLIVRER